MSNGFWILIVFAYFLGAVPFGVIIARVAGKDLRSIGSGNIGATNVARAMGKKWAYVCFFLDCLKGLLPMLVGKCILGEVTVGGLWLWVGVGIAAILGHVFPVYLRFKGGKGAATSLGVVLGLYPYYTLPGVIAFGIWLVFVLVWRYISLASIVTAAAFPVILAIAIGLKEEWRFVSLWPLVLVAVVLAGLVVVRHVENIKRLLEGSEPKVMER